MNVMKIYIVVRDYYYGRDEDFTYSDVYGATTDKDEAQEWMKKSTRLHSLTIHTVELGKTYKAT